MRALCEFATWQFVTRQRRQEFDQISAGHEAALISMGVISGAQREELKGPECPLIFAGVFEKYRELKFIQRETNDTMMIYPREMLKWSDIVDYKAVTGQRISIMEADLIMRIDAIFEGRHDG